MVTITPLGAPRLSHSDTRGKRKIWPKNVRNKGHPLTNFPSDWPLQEQPKRRAAHSANPCFWLRKQVRRRRPTLLDDRCRALITLACSPRLWTVAGSAPVEGPKPSIVLNNLYASFCRIALWKGGCVHVIVTDCYVYLIDLCETGPKAVPLDGQPEPRLRHSGLNPRCGGSTRPSGRAPAVFWRRSRRGGSRQRGPRPDRDSAAA